MKFHRNFVGIRFLSVSITFCSHGCTPLMWAARRGHEEVAHLLIEAGADMEWQDK
jgi:ankyrin repeat protein